MQCRKVKMNAKLKSNLSYCSFKREAEEEEEEEEEEEAEIPH